MKIKKLPLNKRGRDFIIGDLHGCYSALESELNRVNFDDVRDRLFSVGDLIDRGPDSRMCADLIYEPWFHAVQGNHERMAFTAWLATYSNCHRAGDFFRNGGGWTHDIERVELKALLQDMHDMMDHIIYVGNRREGFAVTHSRLDPNEKYGSLQMSNSDIDYFVWDRNIFDDIQGIDSAFMHNWKNTTDQDFVITPYDPNKRLVYVGHNTVANRHTIFLNNHLMLDTGAYKENGKLTMVEHTAVLERLRK